MYNIILSETYLKSLGDCAVYLKNNLNNPIAAARLLDRAEQAALSLAEMPFRFPLSRYRSLADRGIHVMPLNNHCIFYSIDESAQTIYLHLFGYGRRNWGTLL